MTKPSTLSPQDKLLAGRLMACEKMPYFSAALLSLVPRETTQLPPFVVMGVTKRGILMWDPARVADISVEEMAAVLIHEASHLLRDHAGRRDRLGADHFLFNISGDMEINDDLRAAGLAVGKGWMFPETFGQPEGRLAEEYYNELRKQAAQQQEQDAPGQDGQGGEPGGPAPPRRGSGQRNPSSSGKAGNKGKRGGSPAQKAPPDQQDGSGGAGECSGDNSGTGHGWCGSGAGRAMPEEPEDGDADGRSDIEVEAMRKRVAAAIREKAERSQGNVPGGWLRWAEGILQPPKVRWQDKLARSVRAACAFRPGVGDYHYNRPSRRQGALGWGTGHPVLPAMRMPVPRVAIGVDTSGSMGTDELSAALREANGILTAVGAEVDFVACDAEVHDVRKVRHWTHLRDALKGGGGTDFRPVFSAVEKLRPTPDVFVFVTDGMGPAPEVAPGFKTIWLLVGPHRERPCAWGEFIELED